MELASQLADPKLVARLVGVRSIINFHFFRLREAVDDGFQSQQMGGSDAPPWQRAVQLRALYPALVYLGRTEEAAESRERAWNLWRGRSANRSRSRYAAPLAHGPNLARRPISPSSKPISSELSKSDQTAQFAFWVVISEAQLSLVDLYRGDWAGALSHAQASRRSEPGSSSRGSRRRNAFSTDGLRR